MAQFGCASIQKPPYRYQMARDAAAEIERPNVSACTPYIFDVKLDEVRQKTERFVPKGPFADTLSLAVGDLSGTTSRIYKRVEGNQRKAGFICGALAGVGCFGYMMTRGGNDTQKTVAYIGAPFLSVLAGLAGGLAGSLAGGAYTVNELRDPLPFESAMALDSLVIRYNSHK